MCDIVLMVLALILMPDYTAISMWFLAIFFVKAVIENGNPKVYRQVIDDYPVEDCVKPRKCKFLFKNLKALSYKDIPKEMYFSDLVMYVGLWVYTFIGGIVLFFDEYMCMIIGIAYFVIIGGVSSVCDCLMTNRSFISRYKLLNRYNFKFLFVPEDKLCPRKIGQCKVIKERRRGKRTFVTVSMLEIGEIKEKVLLDGGKRQGEDPIYNIYEICKVYYIT